MLSLAEDGVLIFNLHRDEEFIELLYDYEHTNECGVQRTDLSF